MNLKKYFEEEVIKLACGSETCVLQNIHSTSVVCPVPIIIKLKQEFERVNQFIH